MSAANATNPSATSRPNARVSRIAYPSNSAKDLTSPNGALELRAVDELRPSAKNARTHSKRKVKELAAAIKAVGFIGAVIIDEKNRILAGHARHAAAKLLGMQAIPTIRVSNLSEAQLRAFMLADNKFAERAGWNRELLATELEELSILLPELNLDLSLTGFETGEIDVLLHDFSEDRSAAEDQALPPIAGPAVSRRGEIWLLGGHRILCGDARDEAGYRRLMSGERATMVFADPPYNVPIAGHVQGRGRVQHKEFAFASGEMTEPEFWSFLTTCFKAATKFSQDGALHYICMDWRHIDTLMSVGREIYDAMLNLVVWNKTNSGQGSFYRSQHELIGVFRAGDASHKNNIELGKHGRNRSNVWTYAGVNSFGAERDALLTAHPTVKPVALIADAMRDCTSKREVVLDPFLGSGTTIIAAEKIGRRAFGIEYEPAFVDVAIHRWQARTKSDAVLDDDGRTFDEVKQARLELAQREVLPDDAPPPTPPPASAEDWVSLCSNTDAA